VLLEHAGVRERHVPAAEGDELGAGSPVAVVEPRPPQRRYSYRDLVALKVIKSLLDGGLSLQTARKAIEYLRDHMGEDLASASLVLDGSRSVLVRTGEDMVDVVRQGQGVLNIVPLAGLVEQLDASIHEIAPAADADTGAAPARRRRAAGGGG
jgi:DNA-binding transcriptional MerR regulator